MKNYLLIYLLLALLFAIPVFGQENAHDLTQTIRGTIRDIDSKSPVYSAYVIVLGSDKPIGATTDFDGNFRIEAVPVGRHTLKITSVGYEEQVLPNVTVGSGKETILNISLVESTTDLEEVEISAKEEKGELNSELALISARGFTVEETKRYAGTFDDPSRMASSFAGVSEAGNGNNDIIIRGNSPKGLLWRIEGIEAPNPNHFANDGASGGPISILNGNILDNSDFFTGAFPSNYGNAYSGVFDIELRDGNNEKREYAFQAGILGTDVSLEGPFKEGGNGSYLVNYRYSTLDILTGIGFEVAGDDVPRYQDAAFKVNLPTEKFGQFSLFGVGGKSAIEGDETAEGEDHPYYKDRFGSNMGIVGLKNTYLVDSKSYLQTTLAISSTGVYYDGYQVNDGQEFYRINDYRIRNDALRGQMIYNRKFSARQTIGVGLIWSELFYDLRDLYRWTDDMDMITGLDEDGSASTVQAFINDKYRITDELTVVGGIHYMRFNLNQNQVVEPRVSVSYELHPRHTVTAGFGMHSRLEAVSQYLVRSEDSTTLGQQINRDLDFSKARHYVLGYKFHLSPNLHFTTEIYYQDLYNVPVENAAGSGFSLLNSSEGYVNRPLVNDGRGTNYGIDMTLERYFANSYYFMLTNSIYNSTYVATDGVERNGKYNGNYVSNVLAGKEFDMSRNGKKRTFTCSVKGTLAGGNRYTPIDLEQSMAEGKQVRDESQPYSKQANDYQRIDLALKIRTDKKKAAHEWKIDVQNITNTLNTTNVYYNSYTGEIEEDTGLGLLPVISYKIIF